MTSSTITIKDIELCAQVGEFPRSGRYYVQFSIGDTMRRMPTTKVKNNRTHWNENLFLNDTSALVVRVYRKYRAPWKHDKLAGAFIDTIKEITGKSNDGVFEERLRNDTSDGSELTRFTVKFTLTTQPSDGSTAGQLQAAVAANQAIEAISTLAPTPVTVDLLGSAVDTTTNIVDVQTPTATWGVLLKRLELFNRIVTDIATIHPYASLAWSVISAANNVLINQKNRDERTIRLAGAMKDVFAFLDDAQPLMKIKKLEKSVTLLLQQVTECGNFIIDYTKPNSFWLRTAEYTISNVDDTIAAYENKLRDMKEAFLKEVALHTGITVIRMADVVQNIAESIDLNDMPYAEARYVREKGCLPGTRESLLQEICDILNDPAEDAPRVCLLTGVAGSGKSAVAHSIARLFDGQKRLASSYCFLSSDIKRRNSQNLFSTIARDLCDHDPQYRSALWKVVKDNRALRTSTSPSEQLEQFIIEPSSGDSVGPQLVVIIDALDECGDEANRQVPLEAISKHSSENAFPSNLRLLITSRPEQDILAKLSSSPHLVHKQMGDIPPETVNRDIERFIHYSLDKYLNRATSFPPNDWCRALVRRSQGLFQWATTACKFIIGGANLHKRFDILLKSEGVTSMWPLDQLYRTILNQLFASDDNRQPFLDVMTVILTLHEPLSLTSLSALFDSNQDLDVRYIVKHMGSLLDGVIDENKPIRPLHTSFRDFLLDETRSSIFHIQILPHPPVLGQALLACLQDKLRFNICGLKDSLHCNASVPGLADRVKQEIPPQLSYSCRYWMHHLQHAACTPELLHDITTFFKDFFPYWVETISLLSHVTSAHPMQSAIQTCAILSTWAKDQEVAILASEAARFIQVFSPILRVSTPHLYLSAMPQTPTSSPLCKLWADHLWEHVSPTSGHPATWPAEVHNLQGHSFSVYSVIYSPDGKQIASGSADSTIRIWDATTGETIAGPFQGHNGSIHYATYSPDGNQLASASEDKTIRVWDTTTGETLAGPFYGHTDSVNSVAYSPDGKLIVSGSMDKTIRVWDVTTGEIVIGPLQGHTDSIWCVVYSPSGKQIVSSSRDSTIRVYDLTTSEVMADLLQGHSGPVFSISYSPDSKHIVSGSGDNTVRIWNVFTGDSIPFYGHTDSVRSVAYSPNGKYIVSGSRDKTVRVWDVTTGGTIGGPFLGHTDFVWCIAFSPDGEHLVSCSDDKTIRVWDKTIGETMTGPFQGHRDFVRSVAYSSDSKQVVTGSRDNTIRIWDATTGKTIAGPFQGHTESIQSAIYSPDGKHIVSGSRDKTIRIWDATTGKTVAGPFQGHKDSVQSAAYSPNGKHIVSGSKDKTIRIWDATTGDTVIGPLQGHIDYVQSVAYSPDSKHIVSGSRDNTIRIWNAVTGEAIAGPFQGHTDYVNSVAYSPDGKQIISSSMDNTIRLWDPTTGGTMSDPFYGHTQHINSAVYFCDGKYIASKSSDDSVHVWDLAVLDDGWVNTSHGDIFGWVASWNRHFHWLPYTSLIISSKDGCQPEVDFSLLGESWVSCWKC